MIIFWVLVFKRHILKYIWIKLLLKKKKKTGKMGPAGKETCYQDWQPELDPWNSNGKKRGSISTSDNHTCAMVCAYANTLSRYSQVLRSTHTHKCKKKKINRSAICFKTILKGTDEVLCQSHCELKLVTGELDDFCTFSMVKLKRKNKHYSPTLHPEC